LVLGGAILSPVPLGPDPAVAGGGQAVGAGQDAQGKGGQGQGALGASGKDAARAAGPTGYLTDDLRLVRARRELDVFADPDLAQPTGELVERNSTIRVRAVAAAADGTPALAVDGGFISAAEADVARPEVFRPKAQAVFAIDVETGKVLYERGARRPISVASLVKVMTALIVREEIAAGNLSWGTKIKVRSSQLVKMSKSWDAGGTPLKRGKSYTVRQLDTLSLLESHNAAVIQLGWAVEGSNQAYIERMEDKAADLGIDNADIISISGLDNKTLVRYGLALPGSSGGNKISARALGLVTQALLTEFPDVLTTAKKRSAKVAGKTIRNTNQMLKGGNYHVPSLRVDGLKTGYTGSAGYCFIGTAKPQGRHRVAIVIVHAANSKDRFDGAKRLFKTIYQAYGLTG
jgi:D-alanyl-D-alanine carboxypeptidase